MQTQVIKIFAKCMKKKKIKMKKIYKILLTCTLPTVEGISSKFKMWCPLYGEQLHCKFDLILFWHHGATYAWKLRFFFFLSIYLLCLQLYLIIMTSTKILLPIGISFALATAGYQHKERHCVTTCCKLGYCPFTFSTKLDCTLFLIFVIHIWVPDLLRHPHWWRMDSGTEEARWKFWL